MSFSSAKETYLSRAADISMHNPSADQTLVYNATTQTWQNQAVGLTAIKYVGSATSPITDSQAARPTSTGPVYWICADDVTPAKAVRGDLISHNGILTVVGNGLVAPTLLSVTEPSPKVVRLECTEVDGATYLWYEAGTAANGPVATTTEPVRQSGPYIVPGSTLTYWVVAEVQGVYSGESNRLSITTAPTVTEPTPTPSTGLKYTRLVEPLADPVNDPAPAGWRKVEILSQTTYRVNGGSTQTFSGSITMPAGTDNMVYMPKTVAMKRSGGFTILGGRNLAIFGGEINHTDVWPQATYAGTSLNQSARKGMQVNQQTGHIYIEGLWIHGNQINDCLWPNLAASTLGEGVPRYVTLQNCLFEDVHTISLAAQRGEVDPATGIDWSVNELHQDMMQPMNNWTNTTLRLYNFIGRSGYQGIMNNGSGSNKRLELENVYFDMTRKNDDGSISPGYPVFWGGSPTSDPVVIGPNVSQRRLTISYDGSGQPRKAGYPEDTRWDNIELLTGTGPDPAWKWSGTRTPGRTYVP